MKKTAPTKQTSGKKPAQNPKTPKPQNPKTPIHQILINM